MRFILYKEQNQDFLKIRVSDAKSLYQKLA